MLLVWLGLRFWWLVRLLGEIAAAGEAGQPYLIERRWDFGVLERLVAAMNRLVQENTHISETGQGYLDQIRTTLGNLREAVVMVDAEQTIRMANPAFRELLGLKVDTTGQRLDKLLQGSGIHEFISLLREGGGARRQELEVTIQQKRRWLEVSAAPLPESPRAEGIFTLYVFHDITRQKGLEKMRTEFVANASHELRTPVTIIKGFADTLVEDDGTLEGEERLRFLNKIRHHADRLHVLLQDLLLLSRLESAESLLQREPLSLSALVEETAEAWKVCLNKEQRLRYAFSATDDTVMADALRISQVVMNLLENVTRHARGFTEIELATEEREDSVWLRVSDNGCGIPEKDLPHIFQRFYRVDKGRSRESGGTGLGLSIVKHIVQEHGGEISATSERGKGTTVLIRLPRAELKAKAGTSDAH